MPEKIRPEEIEAIARELFGPRWKRPLADACGVHIQTVYDWQKDGAKAQSMTGPLARFIVHQEEAIRSARAFILRHS